MKIQFDKLCRRMIPLLGAGMLLQAGSCMVDTQQLGADLATIILTNLIGGIVFGVLNVPV